MSWEQQEVVRLLKGAPGTQYQQADDANKAIIRDWIRSLLQKGPITVTFTKADGTDRVMKCTLNTELGAKYKTEVLVENEVAVQAKPKKVNTDTCQVWDTEAGAWRSFRWDRLKRIDFKI